MSSVWAILSFPAVEEGKGTLYHTHMRAPWWLQDRTMMDADYHKEADLCTTDLYYITGPCLVALLITLHLSGSACWDCTPATSPYRDWCGLICGIHLTVIGDWCGITDGIHPLVRDVSLYASHTVLHWCYCPGIILGSRTDKNYKKHKKHLW